MENLLEWLKKPKNNNVFAHSSDEKKESLFEHSQLVNEYFLLIIKENKIEKIINILLNDFLNNYEISDKEATRLFIKKLFFTTPIYHDIGKLNPNFQLHKMKNEKFEENVFSFGSDHSKIGAFLYIQKFLKEANNPNNSRADNLLNLFATFVFSYSIHKHHSSTLEIDWEYKFDEIFISEIIKFIDEKAFLSFDKHHQNNILKLFNEFVLNKNGFSIKNDNFSLFALLKLNYSLLTAADYYATTHFMNNWSVLETDFGVFTNDLKKKIVSNVESSQSYNKKTYDELNDYSLNFPYEASEKNLNILRQNLSVEIINGVRQNINKNLFYIEAPTGGGKTNLSMLALAEFLRDDLENNTHNITKVFYVFPFTTLITQTFVSLKDTLGKNDIANHIVQIHSKAGFSEKTKDGDYGENKKNIIDYQFVNYPIALLSHIKFFDILKSNKKSANYLLHRLANSLVIIDELQTYSPKEWDKVIYFINKYSTPFNIKFILMSATLPKIDKLISSEGKKAFERTNDFVYLNKHKEKYFRNNNFAKRVEFDFSLLNNSDFNPDNRISFFENLWGKIKLESELYKSTSKNKKVHTIIEFIYKKTASEFIEFINKNNNSFDEIFVLSGTILEPRRKEIISKIKSDEYKNKNILLITTQVVEAGVDIDMDLGYKDSSIIDSDEQLAGRINRNVKKQKCKLFLFNLDDATKIYGKDYRFIKINNELKDKYSEILNTKNFDLLYDSVMDFKNNHNLQSQYYDNLPTYLKHIKNLNFEAVHKNFKLIDNSLTTETLFIPINIEIKIPNSEELNFSKEEITFLKNRNKFNHEDFISGEKIWELYCDIIENKDEDFATQKINKIIMQGLMSKYSISINTFSKEFKRIQGLGSGEEKYGFYKLNYAEEVYSYETGVKNVYLDSAIIF